MGNSLDDLVSRGGRTSSQSSKGCCALEKACLAKTNQQSGGLLGVFKSRVEFLSKTREKTTSQNNKQPHKHGIQGGSCLKLCLWLGSFPGLPLPPVQGHKGHRGSAHIPRWCFRVWD